MSNIGKPLWPELITKKAPEPIPSVKVRRDDHWTLVRNRSRTGALKRPYVTMADYIELQIANNKQRVKDGLGRLPIARVIDRKPLRAALTGYHNARSKQGRKAQPYLVNIANEAGRASKALFENKKGKISKALHFRRLARYVRMAQGVAA